MARREELQAQMEALQAELDAAADDDHEVWIKDGDREVKVTGKHAKGVLQKLGLVPPDETAGDDGEGEGDGKPDQDDPPKKKGYLR